MSKKIYYHRGLIFLAVISILLSGCIGLGLMKADLQLAVKQYAQAIPTYKEYLAEHPDSVPAHNKLGFAYLKTGRLDNAAKEFETVLKAEPGNSHAILYLGMAYLNKGEMGKAVTTWQAYRNKKEPLVEAEIKRLLTVVQIAESQRLAKKALAQEEQLKAKKPDFDTVSVCYYQDLSPDKSLRPFQKGLAAMLITDMSKIESLRVVERLRLQALFQEMKLGQTGIVDEKTAPRVGHLLGAENLVTGNLAIGSIRATTSLISASAGTVTGSSTVEVEKENFYELPKLIIGNYAKIMGIALTSEEVKAIGIPHTKNYQAFIYYGEGLDAIDEGRWQDAKDLFKKALKLDPKFDLAGDGYDSTPSSSSPSIDKISTMAVPEMSSLVETCVEKAKNAQADADAAAAAAAKGGGGDGGGGD
ncbi:MAG: tetratricopeptide repeat protein [Deltaproteobacteria bacterium]|nr:tetratricopeptide repeat protein [Deltaproteobacteria bacterium]